jgi:hypothetical protein
MRTQVSRSPTGEFTRVREIVRVHEHIQAGQELQPGLFDPAPNPADTPDIS